MATAARLNHARTTTALATHSAALHDRSTAQQHATVLLTDAVEEMSAAAQEAATAAHQRIAALPPMPTPQFRRMTSPSPRQGLLPANASLTVRRVGPSPARRQPTPADEDQVVDEAPRIGSVERRREREPADDGASPAPGHRSVTATHRPAENDDEEEPRPISRAGSSTRVPFRSGSAKP